MSRTPYQLISLASAQGDRRWPFVAILLSVVIIGLSPWLYSWIVPRIFDQSANGLPVFETPYDMMYNPLGDNYTLERAEEIFQCHHDRGWREREVEPSSVVLAPTPTQAQGPDPATAEPRKCPAYFDLIRQDLAPWKEKGITRENIEKAKERVFLRFVVKDGNLYVERYMTCFQTRALFTLWGILLFLEKFRGKVPDVEFNFNCDDPPRFPKSDPGVPALTFAYCSRPDHYDIPFPDWSLWGWAELMIESWDEEREKIVNKSAQTDWKSKGAEAYWSGNPWVHWHRQELVKCNQPGLADIRTRDWGAELPTGKQNSKLEDQCNHKYMIYVEGRAWSVSAKYIFSCGSPTLVISPAFYDFFSRGLKENVHYIPVRPPGFGPELCEAVKQALEFGGSNETEAIRIGKAGQDYMREAMDMTHVYDYMFHLFQGYASLQKFRPSTRGNLHLVTLDQIRCSISEPAARYKIEQAFKVMPIGDEPCRMPEEAFDGSGWQVI